MNYKISSSIFATTTLIFAIAFGVTFAKLQKQPELGAGFPGGDFPREDMMGVEFGAQPFCECPDEEETTEETEDAF